MTLPSRVTVPGLLMWLMVLLPPLLVLRRVGGARSPRVNSGWGEGLLLGSGGVRAVPVKGVTPWTLDTALASHAEPGGRGCKGSTLAVRSLPALWLPVGSSTRPEEAWPRPSLISMVNVVFILPPGSPVPMPTGSGVLGSSEQGLGPPALFSRDLEAKPRPPGPSS